MKKLLVGIMALALLSGVAKADWDPGDGYKMHSPQLPDPYGWDVWVEYWSSSSYNELGDDWQCTETGPVEDIHIWSSWGWDGPYGGFVEYFKISIYSNDPGPPSHPDNLLWHRHINTFDNRLYGQELRGWINPCPNTYYPDNHTDFYQYNITNIAEPFIQQQGEIYWLVISAKTGGGDVSWGWTTATEQNFDNAVCRSPTVSPVWSQVLGPGGEPLDYAFVINGEPWDVPTLTEWGLITLVLLLLAAGVVTIVRKRRAITAR